MINFWEKLKTPFFVLAPMANVTDAAFRQIITKYGKPDVLWTEFISADGLISKGQDALKNDLIFSKNEKPIVAQLFSSNKMKMREASKLCSNLGFDGIDINMGCPDRSIEKQGAGAAMIKDFKKAAEIIQAVKDGIKDSKNDIPISVKTRIGYSKNQIEEWIPFLLEQKIDALIIHARTRKEMSKVPADWEYIRRAVEIRNKMKVKTKIIGNGDIKNLKQGRTQALKTGCDGIMIGRAIFGNPWLFSELSGKKSIFNKKQTEKKNIFLTKKEISMKLKVLIEHTELFQKILGRYKNFSIMKKHYKAYVNGFDGAKELRMKLMETQSVQEMKDLINKFLKTL